MKNHILAAAVMACALCPLTWASDRYFYDLEGVRNNLTVVGSQVIIRSELNDQQLQSLEPLRGLLTSPESIRWTSDSSRILRLSEIVDVEDVRSRLLGQPSIGHVQLAYRTADSSLILMADALVCRFRPEVPMSRVDSICTALDLTRVRSFESDERFFVCDWRPSPATEVLDIANSVFESGLVTISKPVFFFELSLFSVPTDTLWQRQWHFQNTGQNGGMIDADIDLELAFQYKIYPADSLTIAVVDDGVREHENLLQARLVPGWNYYNGVAGGGPGNTVSHGMGTTGLIAAAPAPPADSDSLGLVGITTARTRILSQVIFNSMGFGLAREDRLAAVYYDAVEKGVAVSSNSWGCIPELSAQLGGCPANYGFNLVNRAIHVADSAGVLIVFASGNDYSQQGLLAWPARLPEVLAVGATDNNDQLWDYSMYGSELDLVAPSGDIGFQGDIWTLDQMGMLGTNIWGPPCLSDNYQCDFGGTSAACPQAAGVAARVLERRPDLIGNTSALKSILRYSSERTPFGKLPGDTARVNNEVGWGRLNAARALLSVVRGDANNSGSITPSDPVYIVNYIFNGGPAPVPHLLTGDADGNGAVSISDIVRLVSYIYQGGPRPPISFKY